MNQVSDFIKRYYPSLVFVAGGIWVGFGPAIQSYIAAHPQVSTAIVVLAGVLAHLSPSPAQSQPPSQVK